MINNTIAITERLSLLQKHIGQAARESGRDPAEVQLLAVSKTRSNDELRACAEAGQRRFGENYLSEALEKITALTDLDLEWHFIGPIQSNKTRDIATHFDWVHSVDRLKVARRLSEQRPAELPPLNICLQVNVSGEQSKSGITFAELPQLAAEVARLPQLRLRGLMCIPAPAEQFEEQRVPFRHLREALERLNTQGHRLDTLSMGMSNDMAAAIREGATMVRIGTALFGHRPRPTAER